MPIRKNKKRFDPRYFMDEKMEEPTLKEGRELYAPQYDPREQERWEKEQKRKKKEKKDKDVPRGSEEINYSLKEDLSHLADPAVWEALGLGAAKMASIWVPLLGIGGLAVIIKDAIDYLKKSPESSHDDALQYAVDKAASENELEENLGMTGAKISQMKSAAQPPGSYDDAASMLYELIGSKYVPEALMKVKQNASALGDVGKLEGIIGSEFATEEIENAIRILKVLGKHQSEWDV